jgi:signal transduction histidine kinase
MFAMIAGYIALFSSLMTKITPSLNYFTNPETLKVFIFVNSLINIITFLHQIAYITDLKIINPLQNALREKKRIEKLLRNQKKELSLFNNLMTHDIKNFLTNIRGYSEFFLTQSSSEEVRSIKKSVDHLNTLLDKSLRLAVAGRIIDKKKVVNLEALIQQCLELLPKNKIKIEISHLSNVYGDIHKLKQALLNILKNIIMHSKPEIITIIEKKKYETLTILILNNGKRISERIIRKFKKKGFGLEFKGTHLGLKIIKRIINAHNWNIAIKNCPEPTYIIKIPSEDWA